MDWCNDLFACAVTRLAATCRLVLQLKQTIPTMASVWLHFLKESKVEFFSLLLTGTRLDHKMCFKYTGDCWVKGDAKTQLRGKKSKVLLFYLKTDDFCRQIYFFHSQMSLVGNIYSPVVKMLFPFLTHKLLSSNHAWTAASIFAADAFTLTLLFFRQPFSLLKCSYDLTYLFCFSFRVTFKVAKLQ